MIDKDNILKRILIAKPLVGLLLLSVISSTQADWLSLATKPLYTGTSEAPMMMLVMGRDHTLYYEAYNDTTDLDDDGVIDIKFMPDYAYEGYFNPEKCYLYDDSNNIFEPKRQATTDYMVCSENSEHWSGNFLNYLTMTRMDVLRKVLFGGTRSTDSETETILERVFIPQDAHSWAKSYESEAIDGYDIRDYTPYELPSTNYAHFFGSVTYTGYGEAPILRVRESVSIADEDAGVWDWASTERPVLNDSGDDYSVLVRVCDDSNGDDGESLLESNCQEYTNGQYKPTGILHDYGESDEMLFGLMTGSYNKNLSGGVLRKAISEFSEELDSSTGIFDSSIDGIVATINKMMIHGFNYSNQTHDTNCGWIPNRAITEGECASWGNPIGEILYEAMRYYSGAAEASSTYSYSDSSLGYDESLSISTATWDDPYEDRGTCSSPNILLISDINTSYDSDQLPGAYSTFASTYTGSTLQGDETGTFDIGTLLATISSSEGKTSGEYFIGQSGTNTDNAPTVKSISGLESVRGLAPAEPTKEGSYTSAGVAYFGLNNDIHTNKDSDQNVTTMVVSLASNLPEITVDVDGDEIKIVPFAKTVSGSYGGTIDSSESGFQPTNAIVDWYVEEISTTKGVFRINFEDVEQGADHDMDMIVTYTYEVKTGLCSAYNTDGSCNSYDKGLEISLDSTYAAGSFVQHAGYIISGTTNDGMYLEVKDQGGDDILYYLDTPDTTDYTSRQDSGTTEALGLTATRNFFPSTDDAAEFLPSPLWYAAKWGGFNDLNDNNKPDLDSEWDSDDDGDPDNYFPVTNAGELKDQISAAFDLAYSGTVTSTAPVFSSNYLIAGTLVYQTEFEEENWSGDVQAYIAGDDGVYPSTATWSAADELDDMSYTSRKIFSRRNDGSETVFEFSEPSDYDNSDFTDEQRDSLLGDYDPNKDKNNNKKLGYFQAVVNYIRGDRSNEGDDTTYEFRERSSRLADIVYSTPYYVASSNGHDVDKEVLVFGANDGMVHILDAETGEELAAYIPSVVYDALANLADSSYVHEYSVDGGINAYSDDSDPDDVVTTLVGRLGLGVQGLYAIDVSDMASPSDEMMKWEITTDSDGFDALGFSVASPTMATLATGETGVIFANGYNSTDDEGAIYIANLDDGSLIKRLTVGTQTDPYGLDRPNALAQPAVVDNDADGVADYIYAGDLFGNVWVFDISSDDSDDWGIKKVDGKPLFTAYSPTMESGVYMPQSITSRPSVARHPYGTGILVAFGTGKYIESSDTEVEDQATQSFYVITDTLDDDSVISASRDSSNSNIFTNSGDSDDILSNLQYQSIVEESDTNRLLSTNTVDWSSVSGFYLDLVNTEDGNTDNYGERQVGNSSLFSNRITFTTLIPNEDPCTAGGTGWYMVLNLYTGQTWDTGTPVEDDPTTLSVDESLEIPTDSSNQFLDGVSTGMSSVISATSIETVNDDGSVSESLVIDSTKTCVTLSTGSTVCYDDDITQLGKLSWRHLY